MAQKKLLSDKELKDEKRIDIDKDVDCWIRNILKGFFVLLAIISIFALFLHVCGFVTITRLPQLISWLERNSSIGAIFTVLGGLINYAFTGSLKANKSS